MSKPEKQLPMTSITGGMSVELSRAISRKRGIFTCKFRVIRRAGQVYGYFHQATDEFIFKHLQLRLGKTSKFFSLKQQCSPTTTNKSTPPRNPTTATKSES